jgi:hypothetical protein
MYEPRIDQLTLSEPTISGIGIGRPVQPAWLSNVVECFEVASAQSGILDVRRMPGISYVAPNEVAALTGQNSAQSEEQIVAQISLLLGGMSVDTALQLPTITDEVSLKLASVRFYQHKEAYRLSAQFNDKKSYQHHGRYLVESERLAIRQALGLEARDRIVSPKRNIPTHWARLGVVMPNGRLLPKKDKYGNKVKNSLPNSTSFMQVGALLH